jgi:hypothetical protein
VRLHPDVEDVLHSIAELGFVSVQDGHVAAVPPRGPVPPLSMARWEPTLQYVRDYASFHARWSGEFFLCIYDAWREYSRPVAEDLRCYVPWREVERAKFLGHGSYGEPRFLHRHEDARIYPELPRQVLTYNRHAGDRNALLIPDVEFITTGFEPFLAQVNASDVGWRQKAGKVIWRGARFPADHARSEFDGPDVVHVRHAAVALAAAPAFSACLDASFERTTIADMLTYRYQLDLDGMASAWSGLFWKLSSNSLVFKPVSHWEQWYYRRLMPGTHYVALPALEDIRDAIRRCEDDPSSCRAMVRRANALTASLTVEYAVAEYMIH